MAAGLWVVRARPGGLSGGHPVVSLDRPAGLQVTDYALVGAGADGLRAGDDLVWDADGGGLLYAGEAGDVRRLDLRSGRSSQIIPTDGNRVCAIRAIGEHRLLVARSCQSHAAWYQSPTEVTVYTRSGGALYSVRLPAPANDWRFEWAERAPLLAACAGRKPSQLTVWSFGPDAAAERRVGLPDWAPDVQWLRASDGLEAFILGSKPEAPSGPDDRPKSVCALLVPYQPEPGTPPVAELPNRRFGRSPAGWGTDIPVASAALDGSDTRWFATTVGTAGFTPQPLGGPTDFYVVRTRLGSWRGSAVRAARASAGPELRSYHDLAFSPGPPRLALISTPAADGVPSEALLWTPGEGLQLLASSPRSLSAPMWSGDGDKLLLLDGDVAKVLELGPEAPGARSHLRQTRGGVASPQ